MKTKPPDSEYVMLHRWMNLTFPRTGRCEFCAQTEKRTEYASASHTYTRWRHDWHELCSRCHYAFDLPPVADREVKTHCKYGHLLDEANTYVWAVKGHRKCRRCRAEAVARCLAKRKVAAP